MTGLQNIVVIMGMALPVQLIRNVVMMTQAVIVAERIKPVVKEHVAMFVVRIREIIAVLMVSSVVKELAATKTRPAVTATATLLVVSAVFMK